MQRTRCVSLPELNNIYIHAGNVDQLSILWSLGPYTYLVRVSSMLDALDARSALPCVNSLLIFGLYYRMQRRFRSPDELSAVLALIATEKQYNPFW